MEAASVPAAAPAEGAAPVDTGAVPAPPGAQGPAQPEAQQPDMGQLAQQIESNTQNLEQLRGMLEPFAGAFEQEPEQPDYQQPGYPPEQQTYPQAGEQPQGQELGFLDPNSPGYSPEAAAQQLLGVLQQSNAQAVEEAVSPIREQLQEFTTQRQADALAGEFPELEDPQIAEQVIQASREYAQVISPQDPQVAATLAASPAFWRWAYMAGRQAEAAQGAAQAPPAATLEGAGGASPGSPDAGQLTADSIVGATPRRVLPF